MCGLCPKGIVSVYMGPLFVLRVWEFGNGDGIGLSRMGLFVLLGQPESSGWPILEASYDGGSRKKDGL